MKDTEQGMCWLNHVSFLLRHCERTMDLKDLNRYYQEPNVGCYKISEMYIHLLDIIKNSCKNATTGPWHRNRRAAGSTPAGL